ncbi:hypothetical protein T439DRAFT_316206 [Meredithblackwellia eburnea MCA 4105]
MATPPQMYRSVLRQLAKNSIHPRKERSLDATRHIRTLFEEARGLKAGSEELLALGRHAENMAVYLKAHRIHKELVERYNPTSGLTQEERAKLSAKRVGLNMPEDFDKDVAPTMEAGRPEMERLRKQGKGSLQTMFAHG